jgi:phage gp45-like
MHRATPLNTSIRSYTAGGSRSVVDKVDDTKLMQEMAGSMMHNETRKEIEAAQNYGFTSVVFDAETGQDGKKVGAENFMSFMGGNRSFPAAGAMDDRRHRLYKLAQGDTAMFRGRGDKQQFHMTTDGGFWSAPQDKTVRMQLLTSNSESNKTVQSGSGGAPATAVARDAGTSSSGQQQQQQKRGQEAVYKDGQKSARFVDVTKDKTRASGSQVHLMLDDSQTYLHCHTDKNVYVGGEAGKHTFSVLATLDGPCVNSLGRIG